MATIGERLIALRERSGLSLASVAERAGYRNASSIQKLFRADYSPTGLSLKVADKLSAAFVGLGEPPISEEEVLSLTGRLDRAPTHKSMVRYQLHAMNKEVFLSNTDNVEQLFRDDKGSLFGAFLFFSGDEMGYFIKPSHLSERKIVAFIVSFETMAPRYRPAEIVVFEQGGNAEVGQDVILELSFTTNMEPVFVLGQLTDNDDDHVGLSQLNPPRNLSFRTNHVKAIWPVLSPTDLLRSRVSVQFGLD